MEKYGSCFCGLGILPLLITGAFNAVAGESRETDAAGLLAVLTTLKTEGGLGS